MYLRSRWRRADFRASKALKSAYFRALLSKSLYDLLIIPRKLYIFFRFDLFKSDKNCEIITLGFNTLLYRPVVHTKVCILWKTEFPVINTVCNKMPMTGMLAPCKEQFHSSEFIKRPLLETRAASWQLLC